MKTNVKLLVYVVLFSSLVAFTSSQSRYLNQRDTSNRNRATNRNRANNEPVEQGRTLGLIQPLLGLGLSSIARPSSLFGFDVPIVPAAPYRPASTSGGGQSDSYYGGYGGYGGYTPNYYGGYNYFGGYPVHRPTYAGYPAPFYGGYRPQVYPGNYGGYNQYNGYGGQRPFYSNSRPSSISQRPNVSQQPGLTNLGGTSNPSTTLPAAGSGTANPQAAQIANLLGQLLGQQLRPLLNQGSASSAYDVPDVARGSLEGERYRNRNYYG